MIHLIPILVALALLVPACGQETSTARVASPPESAPAAALHTCGMHPQVVQEGPGPCPICGMDLVPVREEGRPGGSDSGGVSIDSGAFSLLHFGGSGVVLARSPTR